MANEIAFRLWYNEVENKTYIVADYNNIHYLMIPTRKIIYDMEIGRFNTLCIEKLIKVLSDVIVDDEIYILHDMFEKTLKIFNSITWRLYNIKERDLDTFLKFKELLVNSIALFNKQLANDVMLMSRGNKIAIITRSMEKGIIDLYDLSLIFYAKDLCDYGLLHAISVVTPIYSSIMQKAIQLVKMEEVPT